MVKIYAEDRWFSLYIRKRDGYMCKRCGKRYEPYVEGGSNSHLMGLHCAHCFGRGAHMTRWNEKNCLALCYGCHQYVDSRPETKRGIWTKNIGEEEYNKLEVLSHTPYIGWKKDRADIARKYKELFRAEPSA